MKLKTKADKHSQDNEKRRNALGERAKLKSNQSEIIKRALSTATLHQGSSKKILFDDNEDGNKIDDYHKNDLLNCQLKPVLFDCEVVSEDEIFEIKEKSQFSGKKGFELLKLQGSYGNDERFKIDERFIEEDELNHENPAQGKNDLNDMLLDEKNKQLEILNDILGKSSLAKKTKKRVYEMVRYDATNKEHEKFEIKQDEENGETSGSIKKKKKRKTVEDIENCRLEKKPEVVVSKEKFYEVSKDIKSSFRSEKIDAPGGFSLLQTYSQNSIELDKESEEKNVESDGEKDVEEQEKETEITNNEFSIIKSTLDKNSERFKTQSQIAIAKGIWKESFFFKPDDPRFREGVEFMNKKNSGEAEKTTENYDTTRKKLREIIRLHNKKLLAKTDPFKRKIGGMSKKQLLNSRLKTGPKTGRIFKKEKTSIKVNSRGKF